MNQTAGEADERVVAPRYLLYGSCVSRDTFEFLPEPKQLVRYVGRQSLISAGSNAKELAARLPRLKSAFQARTSDEDAAGIAVRKIAQLAAQTDLLMLDLVDERGGVYRADDGAFLTRTVEQMGQNSDEVLGADRIVWFGTDEHYELWLAGWGKLVARLAKLGLTHRAVMLAVPWAAASTSGGEPPSSFGITPVEGNALFARYYEAVAESGIELIRPRWWASPALAEPGHKWGHAPFHYADGVYVDLAAQLARRALRAARSGAE